MTPLVAHEAQKNRGGSTRSRAQPPLPGPVTFRMWRPLEVLRRAALSQGLKAQLGRPKIGHF
jgi:hypothetical protein